MAGVARYISYGPTRLSAQPLVSTHAETGVDMRPHMPTNPENMKRALPNDWQWWSDNRDEMNVRFAVWLAGDARADVICGRPRRAWRLIRHGTS